MSWSHVKAQLKTLEQDELVRLLHALHDLNRENQVFLRARLVAATPDEMAEPYREVIRQVYFPDRGTPTLDLPAARKALSTFKKLGAGVEAKIGITLFCAEMGVACVRQYPNIGQSVYNSIYTAYLDAAKALLALDDAELTAALRPSFLAVCQNVGDSGYGLYENLMDIYCNYVHFPDEDGG